jgi:hypothetical protein
MTTTVELDRRHYHLQNAMTKWCEDNIGQNPTYRNWVYSEPNNWEGLGNWCIASMFGYTFFYFKNESDAIIFTLKWCNNEN